MFIITPIIRALPFLLLWVASQGQHRRRDVDVELPLELQTSSDAPQDVPKHPDDAQEVDQTISVLSVQPVQITVDQSVPVTAESTVSTQPTDPAPFVAPVEPVQSPSIVNVGGSVPVLPDHSSPSNLAPSSHEGASTAVQKVQSGSSLPQGVTNTVIKASGDFNNKQATQSQDSSNAVVSTSGGGTGSSSGAQDSVSNGTSNDSVAPPQSGISTTSVVGIVGAVAGMIILVVGAVVVRKRKSKVDRNQSSYSIKNVEEAVECYSPTGTQSSALKVFMSNASVTKCNYNDEDGFEAKPTSQNQSFDHRYSRSSFLSEVSVPCGGLNWKDEGQDSYYGEEVIVLEGQDAYNGEEVTVVVDDGTY
jgi:hypothetical protein